jgi:hypothetical protein
VYHFGKRTFDRVIRITPDWLQKLYLGRLAGKAVLSLQMRIELWKYVD